MTIIVRKKITINKKFDKIKQIYIY